MTSKAFVTRGNFGEYSTIMLGDVIETMWFSDFPGGPSYRVGWTTVNLKKVQEQHIAEFKKEASVTLEHEKFYWITFTDGSRVRAQVRIDSSGEIDATNELIDWSRWLGRANDPRNREDIVSIEKALDGAGASL